jgi:acetolactate synthase-1/2/3 large subunit
MGWALPASVGSMVAYPSTSHYCVIGDGGFMMTMQELAMIKHLELPLKVILINNGGYSMIKQTQEQWLERKYHASGSDDISFPNYEHVAKAFGLSYIKVSLPEEIDEALVYINKYPGAVLCDVIISSDARVVPQAKFGRSNEDMEPLLSREVFNSAMIIPPLPSSQ